MDAIELLAVRNRWETPELAAEVRDILDALEAAPADAEVLAAFQRTLYRRKYFDHDARGQIILACRCIFESEGNADAFRQPFVSAVLSVVGKEEFADRGLELIEAFDQIKLTAIIETMRSLEYFRLSDVQSVLGEIVRNKVRRILCPPQSEPAKLSSKKERRRKVVEQRIELGRKLAALRDMTPSNKAFGCAVRKHFDLHDSQLVAEMMRVARLYGDRPEMFNADWRALIQLSSSATSQTLRRKLEAKILAGERVNGAEIIRARRSLGRRKLGNGSE
ncbi:hypothetical protein IVA96_20205 [Bradyrhizobium sp. 159]|uniref:hypothetical protein n=1 Tax=Bradyrhizobium sp. 159 TaxID=2782632 RepID=UPI001FF8E00D|nr:hypothetical protein [Bradyrhizobium sp. 159]MCK1618916.1 hypothetical protein [Bradyrhizobium sp. 159]